MKKVAIMRKVGPHKWCLLSKKKNPKTGKRRNLGCSSSKAGIQKRERQVQYFKHHGMLSYNGHVYVAVE